MSEMNIRNHKPIEQSKEDKAIASLKNSYTFIIKIDLEKDTAQCVHKLTERPVGISYDVILTLESANDYFLNNYIPQEDYQTADMFFKKILVLKESDDIMETAANIQSVFSVAFDDGDVRKYTASVIALNAKTVLLCGRDITDAKRMQEMILRNRKNRKLKGHMDSVLAHFKLDAVTFEIAERMIYPIYFSPNVRERMSISDKEFLQISNQGFSIGEFLGRIGISEYDFSNMIGSEADSELTYVNKKGVSKKIYARKFSSFVNDEQIFTIYFSPVHFNQIFEQLLIPESEIKEESESAFVENGSFVPGKDSRIWVRTFGSFDVFVDGVPIRFSSAKSKELLAILVDRRGGSLSAEEAIAYLWEDRAADKQVMSNYRKVAMRMHETLENYGIGDLVINNRGVRSLNMAVVDCDFYRYLLNDPYSVSMFHGQYMLNYSWAENTLAVLTEHAAG